MLAWFNGESLEAEYAALHAEWLAAEANRKRALALKESGAMSRQLIEDYVSKAAVARAQMDLKKLQLGYVAVLAPDDGVISSRNASLGAVTTAGDKLLRLIRQGQLT